MRDLFVGYQWDAVDRDVRLLAGKIFYNKLKHPIAIQLLGYTEQKQQICK